MATITALRLAYKQSGSMTDTTCLRIVRKDGTIYRFVALDKNLVIEARNNLGTEQNLPSAVTYTAASIADFSAYGSSIGEFGQVDIEGTIEALGFVRSDIINGLFDRARIYIFATNYNRPIEDEEPIMSGFWGEVTLIDGRFIAKFSSLIDTLALTTGRVYQASCDAQLGSYRCGVPLVDTPDWEPNTVYAETSEFDKRIGSIVKHTGTEISGTSRYFICTTPGTSGATEPSWNLTLNTTTSDGTVQWTTINPYQIQVEIVGVISDTELEVVDNIEDNYFTNGYLEALTGENAGLKIPIENGNTYGLPIKLLFAPNNSWTVGDIVLLTAGCNKTKTACSAKFFNSYNYQGFPNVPGRTAFNQGNPTY